MGALLLMANFEELDPGVLRHRVDHQRMTEIQDAYNQPIKTWTTLATYWAYVQPLTGRELWLAQQIKSDVTHKVTMRGGVVIDPKDRLLYGGRVLNIGSVRNLDEFGAILEFSCTERVAGA